MKTVKKALPWLLVVLWMMIIFWFSHQPALESANLSSGISQMVIDVLEKMIPSLSIDIEGFHHFIRKNAHFFIYLILGLLVDNGLRSSGVKGYSRFGLAVIICVLYAVSDEIHQLFIPGRAGQIRDVLIDSGGALTGVCLGLVWRRGRLHLNS